LCCSERTSPERFQGFHLDSEASEMNSGKNAKNEKNTGWLGQGLALVTLSVALAGCGGSSNAGSASSTSSTASASPTVSGTPPSSVAANDRYDFQPTMANSGGKSVSFRIQNKPAWATFGQTTGKLSGTPNSPDAGKYANIVITATDGTNTSTLAPFSIQVTPAGSGGGSGSSSSSSSGGSTSSSSGGTGASGALSISVQGNRLVDGRGNTVQLRGVMVAGNSESTGSHNEWDWSNLTAGNNASPDWAAIKAWKVNAIRYSVGEASWQGRTTINWDGSSVNNDANHNYVATVEKDIADITAMGMYVILVQYDSAPGNTTFTAQNPMGDADHTLALWTSLANTFKNNPAVLFEPFNEPFLGTAGNDVNPKAFDSLPNGANYYIRNGGAVANAYYASENGNHVAVPYTWTTVGFQQVLDAIRGTGATNVVVMGGQDYDNDLTWWTTNPPTDALNQIAITYHAYYTTYGYALTNDTPQHTAAQSIAMLTNPGVPVILTEIGDNVGGGASTNGGSPGSFMTQMAQLLDNQGWSGMAWTWNPWGGSDTLIQNITSYTPTQGEGQAWYNWTINHK
jgi:endoglucanase